MKLATLCYLQKDGKTLMIHRNKKSNDMHRDLYNGIGGKLEDGESPEDCAIREIHEETGLTVTHPTLKGMLTFPAHGSRESWYVFVFVANEFSGNLIDPSEGTLKWIDNGTLATLPLNAGDYIFMPYLQKSGIFSGKFVYD
ncbi:8-oxo-dGTP diphosphatase [Candidatus Nomurabacteria bacterium]|nr:8-oxo-dGTP diphosphatase [Candidatus Nomurabacteria bacterium]